MIVFDLACDQGHIFEAWFRDSKTFEAQANAGDVPCPTCGSTAVKKTLMSPNLSGSKKRDSQPAMTAKAAMETQQAAEVRQALQQVRKTVEEKFDYVGPQFAEEARKIHYGESDARDIYGETSESEAKALNDEGVAVQRIPWVPREDS